MESLITLAGLIVAAAILIVGYEIVSQLHYIREELQKLRTGRTH